MNDEGSAPIKLDRLSDASSSPPRQFASHRSRLIAVLRDNPLHRDEVRLEPDQWLTLVAWIDANAPYYDCFYNCRPADGGPPIRNIILRRIAPLRVRLSKVCSKDNRTR